MGIVMRVAAFFFGWLGALVAYGAGTPLVNAAGVEIRVLALGDSLTAGYGLPAPDGFPAQLERALKARGRLVRVINAGVSGDTSAGGLARLDWALADDPQVAIVELGANDALRGTEPSVTKANLDALLARLRAKGVRVLLAGMKAPPNMGPDFAARFDAIYPELARKHGVPLYPFFLDGVAARPELNQPDAMHPNARGVTVIVDRLLPHLLPLLEARP